jgi:DNA-binding beta-propeller fold protein YncE
MTSTSNVALRAATVIILSATTFAQAPAGRPNRPGAPETPAAAERPERPVPLVSGVPATPPPAAPHKEVLNWTTLPAGMEWGEIPATAVTKDDHVLVLRRAEPPVLEFDRQGKLLKQWGHGMFVWTHGIRVDRDGFIWITDGRAENGRGQQVFKFDRNGKLLMTLGTKGVGGVTDATFDGPCDVDVDSKGNIYVADGHRNNRIVKFDKNGKFIKAWGTRGTASGQLSVPHALAVDSRDRVLVTDRGNQRVQVFDAEGNTVALWTGFGTMPDGIAIGADDTLYVADVGEGGGVTIASAKDGSIRSKISGTRVEGLSVDRFGTVYVGETLRGAKMRVFAKP